MTFGSPRTVNAEFANVLARLPNLCAYRVANGYDVVPRERCNLEREGISTPEVHARDARRRGATRRVHRRAGTGAGWLGLLAAGWPPAAGGTGARARCTGVLVPWWLKCGAAIFPAESAALLGIAAIANAAAA